MLESENMIGHTNLVYISNLKNRNIIDDQTWHNEMISKNASVERTCIIANHWEISYLYIIIIQIKK